MDPLRLCWAMHYMLLDKSFRVHLINWWVFTSQNATPMIYFGIVKMTKCGRYGIDSFDYSPTTIRESVKQSLERLKTDYLDTVYLHDVEFVCTPIAPRLTGNHIGAIKEEAASYGLAEGDEALVRGEGDQKVLDALSELRGLQREGLIKNVGITGNHQAFNILSLFTSLFSCRFPTTHPFAPRYFGSPHTSLQAS